MKCRLRWGRRGARAAAEAGETLVVVDVLRFSTTVTTAVHEGGTVMPRIPGEDGDASLSPLTHRDRPGGTLVSLNGATCSRAGGDHVLAGSLLNASAVAEAVRAAGRDTTVLACGERWPDGALRVCLEDYLGAGAVLAGLSGRDADAEVCAAAFETSRGRLEELLLACPSGVELVEWGLADDVRHAARIDAYEAVPALYEGAFRQLRY